MAYQYVDGARGGRLKMWCEGVEVEMNPYGEDMGEGMTYALFLTKTRAQAYVKELQKAHRFNFRSKDGGLSVRMPKWVVAAMEVQY